MNWILAISLYSNPTGYYVKEYVSEKQCVSEMKKLIASTKDDDNIKSIGCVNSEILKG